MIKRQSSIKGEASHFYKKRDSTKSEIWKKGKIWGQNLVNALECVISTVSLKKVEVKPKYQDIMVEEDA